MAPTSTVDDIKLGDRVRAEWGDLDPFVVDRIIIDPTIPADSPSRYAGQTLDGIEVHGLKANGRAAGISSPHGCPTRVEGDGSITVLAVMARNS